MISAIAVEGPDYARAMEGEFGRVVRLGVENALGRFVDLIEDPTATTAAARATYVNLGRGEMRAGRSLDALLSAYRLGSRLAWRRFVEAGREVGFGPTRSTRSARRSSPTSTSSPPSPPRATPRNSRVSGLVGAAPARAGAAARPGPARRRGDGARRRRGRRLAAAARRGRARDRARGEPAPAGPDRARGRRPPRWRRWSRPAPRRSALPAGVARRSPPRPTRWPRGSRAASARRRSAPGIERLALVLVPDPGAPARRRARLRAATEGRPAALGPAVPLAARRPVACGARSPRTPCSSAGRLGDRQFARAEEHLPALVIAADPALAAELSEQRLAPLAELPEGPRERLTETLRAWLDRPGQVQAVAAERRRPPADRALPRASSCASCSASASRTPRPASSSASRCGLARLASPMRLLVDRRCGHAGP